MKPAHTSQRKFFNDQNMKVYAIPLIKDGKEYRLKTLLQFGDSTKLIGSAVLMNPGSSKRLREADDKSVQSIKTFFKDNHNIENADKWYEYSVDPTMQWVEKIFNGWYISPQGNKIELEGIILLFNCFYYKTQSAGKAINEFNQNENESVVFQEHNLIAGKPVYFGWGGDGKSVYKEIASDIFEKYLNNDAVDFYDLKFEKNKFSHPRGVQFNSKNMQEYLKLFFDWVHK